MIGYLLVTFAVTWAAWLGPSLVGLGRDGVLWRPGGPVFLFGVFAPALVAIAFTARQSGSGGVWRLVAPIGHWQVAARWYLFALGYTAAIELLAALLQRLATGAWPPFGDTPWPLLWAAVLFSTWVQAGEEVGWRGYVLPRIAPRLGLGGASLVVGVIWALWHLPLFYLPDTGSTGQSFPLYLALVTAISVALAWLYWRTGRSLLLVMVMHAAVNNTGAIVVAVEPGAADPLSFHGSFAGWTTVALGWVVAAVLLYQMRGAALEPAASRQGVSTDAS